MKWINEIKANSKPWQDFISGLKLNIRDDDSDTIMITDCFAVYLQKMAADQNNPIATKNCSSHNNITNINEAEAPKLKRTSKTLRSLNPLKQVV